VKRVTLAVSMACLVLAAPGWAGAATGDLDGRVGEPDDRLVPQVTAPVVDQRALDDVRRAVGQTATTTVDAVTETVTKVSEPLPKPVRDAVAPVVDAVQDSVAPVVDDVRDVTRPVTDAPDPGPRPDRDRDRPAAGGAPPAPPAGTSTAERPAPAGPAEPAPRADRRPAVPAPRDQPAAAAAQADAPPPPSGAPHDGPVRTLIEAAEPFTFPLTVAALVLLFLAVQGRIDARDPKLGAAADAEELVFG